MMFKVIQHMMHSVPQKRPSIERIAEIGAVRRAREWMASRRTEMIARGLSGGELFAASPLAGEEEGVLAFLLDGEDPREM